MSAPHFVLRKKEVSPGLPERSRTSTSKGQEHRRMSTSVNTTNHLPIEPIFRFFSGDSDTEQVNATLSTVDPSMPKNTTTSAACRVDTAMSPLFKLQQQKNTSAQRKRLASTVMLKPEVSTANAEVQWSLSSQVGRNNFPAQRKHLPPTVMRIPTGKTYEHQN